MAKPSVAQAQQEVHEKIRKPAKAPRHSSSEKDLNDKLREVLTLAEELGLLSGSKTYVIRGRMPAGLIKQAKRKSGITSDSKLLEAALANLALPDEYAQWLLAQRGTVSPEIDLEF
jgi:hypothetical protein